MSFCKDCISGVRHEGTQEGKMETIGGVSCYVATPTVDYPTDKVIMFITDVFGIPLPNNPLLADDFARNGFKVVMPELFNGDAIPPDALEPGSTFDIQTWFGSHAPDGATEIVRKVIAALKEQGVTKFGSLGYCYGARVCFNLAFNNEVQAVAAAHPSLLKFPDDFEKYIASSQAPLLINSCEFDTMFPLENAPKVDGLFASFGPGYKRTYYQGCTHGFAVRGDMSKPEIKAGKEGAFTESVKFMLEKL
ncbi:alpha/beta-hydrolase [Epithele typhae]|uniref:alpha/beta-hydrolase n=1 Tax=Epithele typhae TaxID=378194 RepID=UPI0020085CC8|nr:alpha/beta-hydrolase [Epithele typhae]KAH9940882.1 alpha/beta-hydrolase [Epithele typhae]